MADEELEARIRVTAHDETGEIMRGIKERIETISRGFELLAGGTILGKNLTAFADLTRVMERVGVSTKATDERVKQLGNTFDDVAKMTGRPVIEIARNFQKFYESSNQALAPAVEQFETLGKASKVTGASIDSLARITAAAVNNMKVPTDEMDEVIKKMSITLPATMIEAFSELAPRVTATMEAIGLTGKKNFEEIALVATEMNKTFGNSRTTFSVINGLLGELSNGSSKLGGMMVPMMRDVQKNGGSMLDVFDKLYHRMDRMGAFNPQKAPFIQRTFGVDFNTLKGLKDIHDHMENIRAKVKAGMDVTKAFREEFVKFDDSRASLDKLIGSAEQLGASFADLMIKLGANDILKRLADEAERAAIALDKLNDMGKGGEEGKAAANDVFGTAPDWAPWLNYTPMEALGIYNHPHSKASEEARSRVRGVTGKDYPDWNKPPEWGVGDIPSIDTSEHWTAQGLPHFAQGGIVNKPTIAMIGEHGPEEITPLGGGTGTTADNTSATVDNTMALRRLSADMSQVARGAMAYTPGAGEAGTPSEAGIYGGSGPLFRPGIGPGARSGGGFNAGRTARGGQSPRGMGRGHVEDIEPQSIGTTGGEHFDTIAEQRAPLMAEVDNDPETKHMLHQMMQTEGGGAATVEALFNRTAMIRQKIPGYSIKDELRSGFYGPLNRMWKGKRGPINISNHEAAKYNRQIAQVAGGSDILKGRTDQGTYGDPNAGGPGRISYPGMSKSEIYNFWKGSRRGHNFNYSDTAGFAAHQESMRGAPHHDTPAQGGDIWSHGASPVPHMLNEHRAMREEMERPIRMAFEAPALQSGRQRMSKMQSRWQSEDALKSNRWASGIDIGFA